MKAFPELTEALREMLDRMDSTLRASGYAGSPVIMYLAGGVAVNYYCGTRYTEDVDASFSRRILLPQDLSVNYRRKDGTDAFIYFDYNYHTSFALFHDEFEESAREWEGIGNEQRLVHLRVLSPVDLAVSKLSRFSEQDRADIRALAVESHFTPAQLRERAMAALANFIGDKRPVITSLDLIRRDLEG